MQYVSDEECEQAVRFLLDEIPEGMLVRIFEEVRKGPGWLITHHFRIGMEVRNLLRAGVMALPPEDAIFKKNAEYIDLYNENWILYYGQSFPLQLLQPSVYSLA